MLEGYLKFGQIKKKLKLKNLFFRENKKITDWLETQPRSCGITENSSNMHSQTFSHENGSMLNNSKPNLGSLIQNTSTQNYCNFTSTRNQEFQTNQYETKTKSLMEPTLNPENGFAQENNDPQSYISSARKKDVLNEISLENLQPFGKSSSLLLSSFPGNNRRNSVISVDSSSGQSNNVSNKNFNYL